MKEFFQNLVNKVWSVVRPVLPDKIKRLVVLFLTKNQKILVLLDPAMKVVKAVALLYGGVAGQSVAVFVSAVQRMMEEWNLTPEQLPVTVQTVVSSSEADRLVADQIKVALRDFAKFVLENKKDTSDQFTALSDSEKNLLVEMAYNMVKSEIEEIRKVVDGGDMQTVKELVSS